VLIAAIRIASQNAQQEKQMPACAAIKRVLRLFCVRQSRRSTWETVMTWKTPKIVEVPVGMEINMYACAARK
jgi:coenzyme PQQ precursor peptide PqqA